MTNIDKLIYDALAGRRSVALPGVGTLEVKRRGAKKISDTQIAPPQNGVVFLPGEIAEEAESVVSLVAADRSVDLQEAVAVYGSWLEGARRADGSLAIDGVGETGGDTGFVVTEGLHAALNPVDEEIVIMETEKRKNRAWIWILIVILALLLSGGFWCWKKGCFQNGDSGKNAIETVVAPIAAPPAADSLASSAAPGAAADAPVRAATSSGERFHVIAGAFSIESNADNYISDLKRRYPELTPVKLADTGNGYNMVSILQAATEREAKNKMNLYWDISPSLWIYERK